MRDFEIRGRGKLDPFKLTTPVSVDMSTVLRDLEVSCVAPNDPVFYSSPAKTVLKKTEIGPISEKVIAQDDSLNEEKVSNSFSSSILALYKKIPLNSEVSIDELVDENHSLREVMQGLLTLEISRFVKMLPGDRVKRNI